MFFFYIGHTAVVKDQLVIIFGGEAEDMDASSDICYYNFETNSWSFKTSADYENEVVPEGRKRHAACLSEDGSTMIITGGLSNTKQVLNDIYLYDLKTQTWDGPREFVARYDHSVTMHDNKLWAFGGLSPNMDRVSDVAWYDFETNTIGKIHLSLSLNNFDYYPSSMTKTGATHFYGSGVNGTMLNVAVPGGSIQSSITTTISAFDMNSLKWRMIISDSNSDCFAGYNWHHMIVVDSKLILLGVPEELAFSQDEKISHVLTMDLSNFGYLNNGSDEKSRDGTPPLGTIGHDMYEFYKRSEMCDFEITAVEGHVRPELNNKREFVISEPIKVHMMVLLARWPHFQRIISSEMSEFHDRKLYIPEPVAWVRKLIEFMYRDSIEGCDLNEVTGLLVLANVYELPRLRNLCLEALSRYGIPDFECAVLIWERAYNANENLVLRDAAAYCFRHWGQIVRTMQFSSLSKLAMLSLCTSVTKHSYIADHPTQQELYNIDVGDKQQVVNDDAFTTDTAMYDDDEDDEAVEYFYQP